MRRPRRPPNENGFGHRAVSHRAISRLAKPVLRTIGAGMATLWYDLPSLRKGTHIRIVIVAITSAVLGRDFERKITARGVVPTNLEEGAARGQKAC